MKIEPRHLLHIAAIVDAGTFAVAAERLGMTQPALSRTVATVEHRIGSPLFERNSRPLVPTEICRALADQGRSIRAATTQASLLVDRLSAGEFGTLRLGAPPFLCDGPLSRVIARFLAAHRGVRINLTPEYFPQLQDRLIADQIDAIIGPITLADRSLGLAIDPLVDDTNVIVCRAGHPLATRRRISISDLEASQWISHSTASTLHADMQAALTAAGVNALNTCFESASASAVLTILLETDSLTVLPRNSIADLIDAGHVRLLRFPHKPVSHPIGLITVANRVRSAVLIGFTEMLSAQLDGRLDEKERPRAPFRTKASTAPRT